MDQQSWLDRIKALAESHADVPEVMEIVEHVRQHPKAPLPDKLTLELVFVAACEGDLPLLEHVAAGGYDIARSIEFPMNVAECAARNGHVETTRWLVQHGFPVNDRTTEQGEAYCSILQMYSGDIPLEAVKLLVEAGAALNVLTEWDGQWNTVLSRVYEFSDPDVINYLQSQAAKFPAEQPEFQAIAHEQPDRYAGPLGLAVDQNNLEEARRVLDRWPAFTASEHANEFLERAAHSGLTSFLAEFVRRGVNINGTRDAHQRPIELAADQRHWDTVRWLIENGAEIAWEQHPKHPRGWPRHSPVMRYPIIAGRTDIVKLLVERGAPLHAASNDGVVFSALSLALKKRNTELAVFLRSRGGLEERDVPGRVHPLLHGERDWFGEKAPAIAHFGITRRNFLLYTYHCLKRLDENWRDDRSRRFLELLLERAENRCSEQELLAAYEAVLDCEHGTARDAFEDDERQACSGVASILSDGDEKRFDEEFARMADLLREIVGNPFRLRPETLKYDRAELKKEGLRCIEFQQAWRTDTVRDLAQSMYDQEDFARMPALAAALTEAGCDEEAILTHCRGDQPHVRGCWVLDLILEKDQLPYFVFWEWRGQLPV